MKPLSFVLSLTACVLVCYGATHSPLRAAERVSLKTDDGVTLSATWYEPASRPAPAVILVHALQRSQRDWEGLASQLATAGIGALAIDLRGHGESSGSPQDYTGMVQDVRTARRFLAARADVTPARLGIGGASIGASLAALAAVEEPSVVSIALLSPSLDYRGLRLDAAMRKYATRPALLVASDDDGYAARTVKELQKTGGGRRDPLLLTRAGHGTAMLSGAAELAPRIVEWFRQTLL